MLGFARALLAPFEDEEPEVIDGRRARRALRRRRATRKLLARAEKLGFLVPLGEGRYEVPSPTLLRAGEELRGARHPARDGARRRRARSRASADGVARAFVKLFLERGLEAVRPRRASPRSDWPEVREALERLRPLATEALVAIFQPAHDAGDARRRSGASSDRRAKG